MKALISVIVAVTANGPAMGRLTVISTLKALDRMKICFVTKYPPIVGGVSSKIYWHLQLLSKSGAEVHVVTNALEASHEFKNFGLLGDSLKPSLGKIMVHNLEPENDISYIPYANPYVSRLAALAQAVVEKYSCNLIIGVYFEPYGIAASIVSKWTGVPYAIMHAGSDIGRLYKNHELHLSYRSMLRNADAFITKFTNIEFFTNERIDIKKIFAPYFFVPIKDFFNPNISKINFEELQKNIKLKTNIENYKIYNFYANNKLDFSAPIIGIYGKASTHKGNISLIRALGKLKKNGYQFNFIFVTQASFTYLNNINDEIYKNEIECNTFLIPFFAVWEIPHFIRFCDCICYLEHDFPIKNHTPIIPLEVFSCGTYLITSEDIIQNYDNEIKKYCGVVNPRFVESIYDGIKHFFDNLDDCNKQGKLAYEEIIIPGQHDIKYHANNIKQYYKELIECSTIYNSVNKIVTSVGNINNQNISNHLDKKGEYIKTSLEILSVNEKKKIFINFIKRFLKISCKVFFKAQLSKIINVFFTKYPKKLDDISPAGINAFFDFLLLKSSKNKSVNYELILYEVSHAKILLGNHKNTPNYKRNIDFDLIPIMPNSNIIEDFEYNILYIKESYLNSGFDIQNTPHNDADTAIIFQSYNGGNGVKLYTINSKTKFLLSLIDGERTLNIILDEYNRNLDNNGIVSKKILLDVIEYFYYNKIITFK